MLSIICLKTYGPRYVPQYMPWYRVLGNALGIGTDISSGIYRLPWPIPRVLPRVKPCVISRPENCNFFLGRMLHAVVEKQLHEALCPKLSTKATVLLQNCVTRQTIYCKDKQYYAKTRQIVCYIEKTNNIYKVCMQAKQYLQSVYGGQKPTDVRHIHGEH